MKLFSDALPVQGGAVDFDPAHPFGAVFWGIVAGIIAGVFTSVILVLAGAFFSQIFIPWYQCIIFRGAILDGTWTYDTDLGDFKYSYIMSLKQSAHRLEGKMFITKKAPSGRPADGYVQEFALQGESWEGYVTLTMQTVNRESLSFATTLLKIEHRGKRMVGHLIYRGLEEVGVEPVNWLRTPVETARVHSSAGD